MLLKTGMPSGGATSPGQRVALRRRILTQPNESNSIGARLLRSSARDNTVPPLRYGRWHRWADLNIYHARNLIHAGLNVESCIGIVGTAIGSDAIVVRSPDMRRLSPADPDKSADFHS